jgi:hypothetical protein
MLPNSRAVRFGALDVAIVKVYRTARSAHLERIRDSDPQAVLMYARELYDFDEGLTR